MFDEDNLDEKIFEIFDKYDNNYQNIKKRLIQFKKFEVFQDDIIEKLKEYFNKETISQKDLISNIEKLSKNKRIKFKYENIEKLNLPKIGAKTLKNNNNYFNGFDEDENKLKKSVYNIEGTDKDDNIVWKPCHEIDIFKGKDLVILPDKINYSNFNQFKQGSIGDCYFISCVQALSRIPQLLNFILRLSSKDQNNEINKDDKILDFKVNFFIDGQWKIVKVKNSFPFYEEYNKLVGVTPYDNELYLMILEKAWAIINGGYDKIDEGGNIFNIFELFLGCKCDIFMKDDYNNYIDNLYDRIRLNENFFGTLSLCGCNYYNIINNEEEMEQNKKIYDKKDCLEKNYIEKDKDGHAYNILKTHEMTIKSSAFKQCKFLIISNPHGKGSELIGSGIELKKIKEILMKNFGKNNENQFKKIIEINDKYEETGLIYMPLEYFKEWAYCSSVCYTHFDCLNYSLNINNEYENLYIYKIKSNVDQLFTCQMSFPSFRAHMNEIDEIKLSLEIDKKNIYEDKILLYYYKCGIKIMKNNENFDIICKPFFSNENDESSIQEIKANIKKGEYIIMLYIDSSFNKNVVRFLSQYEIKIELIYKTQKNSSDFYSTDELKQIIKNNSKNITPYKIKPKDFLPGMREYYLHFKKLSEETKLDPEDAIFSISKEGNAIFYEIMDPFSMNKIFSTKEDKIYLNTLQFIDNFGFPYKVNNFKELINEMKLNREPLDCLTYGYDKINKKPLSSLLTEYDEYHEILTSGVIYFNIYYNKAKNEDILVISDKFGNNVKRNQKPLLIILLDISGSMKEYYKVLQNKIIPKLLEKLGYKGIKDIMPEIEELLHENKITMFDLLMCWSSEIRYENFIKDHNLTNKITKSKIKQLREACQDMIALITFSDKSELYFYDPSQFEDCKLSGWDTFFKGATINLKNVLDKISRERSIRLLCFSDGEIHDSVKSMKNLEEILNSPKIRHQMKSLSVRVCHGNVEPDAKVLLKLSKFSHPISDMCPINIDPKNIDEVVEMLYQKFQNDGMNYYLKLFSSIIMMSSDFSDDYSHEQYFNQREGIFRIKDHKDKKDYEELINKQLIKLSSGKKIKINEFTELNEKIFNKISKKIAPLIAQNSLERKANKDGRNINKQIIDYLQETENELKCKNKLFDLIKKIDEDNKIYEMKPNQLCDKIREVKEEAEDIIYKNEANFLKEEKKDLINRIYDSFPEIDEEIKSFKTINKNIKKLKKKKIINNDLISYQTSTNSQSEELKKKNEINFDQNNKETEQTSKITTFYHKEKEIYDNFIYDQDIFIEKRNFKNGYHEAIFLKSEIEIKSDFSFISSWENIIIQDEYQQIIINLIEKGENILIQSHENIDKTIFVNKAKEEAKHKNKRIIYVCVNKSLINQIYKKLKESSENIGLISEETTKNKNASFIIVTIESLRNMIYKQDELINKIYLVIFDNIYYMRNSENDNILEEIIILLNNEIKYIFFSTPFPNNREFGIWMTKLKNQPFNIINYLFSNICLKHYIFPDNNINEDLFLIYESRPIIDENCENIDKKIRKIYFMKKILIRLWVLSKIMV